MYILPETTKLLEYKPVKDYNAEKVQKINKTAYELQEYKGLIDKKVKDGEISIFSLSRFPNSTNNYNFTPQDVKEAITEYSICTIGMDKILEKYGIKRESFYLILSDYNEIRQIYEAAFYRKADSYEDLAVDQIKKEIPEECWKETKWGKELSYPGVRLLEHRFNGALRLAAIHNREVYGDKTQIDQRSVSVNFSGSINDVSPNNRDISNIDLIRDLFGKYRQ